MKQLPETAIGVIGSLSKDVFEQWMSTESEAFSLYTCLDANKFVLLSFFSLIKTIYCTELVGYTLNSRTHKLYLTNHCFYSPRGFL